MNWFQPLSMSLALREKKWYKPMVHFLWKMPLKCILTIIHLSLKLAVPGATIHDKETPYVYHSELGCITSDGLQYMTRGEAELYAIAAVAHWHRIWKEENAPRQWESSIAFTREQHLSYALKQGLQVWSKAAHRKVNRLPTQSLFYIADKMPDLCQHCVLHAVRKQRRK